MAHIEVSAYYCSFFLPQLVAVVLKGGIPLLYPVLQPVKLLACVGDIRSDEIELLELDGEGSSLL
jgi:hypothetical protein